MNDKLKSIEGNLEEMEKCKNNPCYFYNTYVRKEGERIVSEEEYSELVKQLDMSRFSTLTKSELVAEYPLTFDKVFWKRRIRQ